MYDDPGVMRIPGDNEATLLEPAKKSDPTVCLIS